MTCVIDVWLTENSLCISNRLSKEPSPEHLSTSLLPASSAIALFPFAGLKYRKRNQNQATSLASAEDCGECYQTLRSCWLVSKSIHEFGGECLADFS